MICRGVIIVGVLEDAVIKAKGAADFAGRKTGEFVELSKLRISIAEVDKKIEAEYLELGKMVYKASREHTDCTDYVQEKATAIDLLLKKRRDLEEKVNALRKVKKCPECSHENQFDANYCNKCGAKL